MNEKRSDASVAAGQSSGHHVRQVGAAWPVFTKLRGYQLQGGVVAQCLQALTQKLSLLTLKPHLDQEDQGVAPHLLRQGPCRMKASQAVGAHHVFDKDRDVLEDLGLRQRRLGLVNDIGLSCRIPLQEVPR